MVAGRREERFSTASLATEAGTATRLLLECLREDPTAAQRTLQRNDVEALAHSAIRHGVAGLLLRALGPHTSVSPELLRPLREERRRVLVSNLRLWTGFADALRVLDGAGVPTVALKGACLAELFYRDLSLRPMCDVDILVPKDDVVAANAALRRAGFGASAYNDAVAWTTHYHFAYLSPAGVSIELHWNLTHPERAAKIDLEDLWARCRRVRIAGRATRVPCHEHLLLHLAEHLVKHRFTLGLSHLEDFRVVIDRAAGEIEWRELRATAVRWGLERPLSLALHLARELLGATLPDAARLEFPVESLPAEIIDRAKAVVLDELQSDTGSTSGDLARLIGATSLHDAVRTLRNALFVPRQMIERDYRLAPSWRSYLMYPHRWYTQMWRHGPALLQGGRHTAARDVSRARTAVTEWVMKTGCQD